MAIDTAEKRKSIAGILTSFPVAVTPNALKDVQWRQEAGWGYPGIIPQSSAPQPEEDTEFHLRCIRVAVGMGISG